MVLASAAGCASAPAGREPGLAARIDAVLDEPPLDGVHFGALVLDAGTGDTLYRRNAGRHFAPASNMKLLTSVAALLRLGPEYRFTTEVWSLGGEPGPDGALDGDLIVVGHGDPSLSARFWPNGADPLRALADSLLAAGVREVRGSLVVDVSAWDSAGVVGTWMVGDLGAAYAATGGAFVVAEGTTTLVVEGTREGSAARVSWNPRGDETFVRSEVVTLAEGDSGRVRVRYLPESRRLHLLGSIAAGAVDTLRVATRDPTAEAAKALLAALTERGVHVREGLRIRWDPGTPLAGDCQKASPRCATLWPLARLRSPPLMDLVRGILEPSQNWMADQLVKHLGEVETGRGSWRSGLAAVRAVLTDSLGVDSLSIDLRDGSGLSAYDLVTPRAVAKVLQGVLARPWKDRYREALPSPGEVGSTLERRLAGLEGRLQAKTGTITHVNSLSGFVTTSAGLELVFVLLSNGSGLPSPRIRAALDRVVEILAAQSGSGSRGSGALRVP